MGTNPTKANPPTEVENKSENKKDYCPTRHQNQLGQDRRYLAPEAQNPIHNQPRPPPHLQHYAHHHQNQPQETKPIPTPLEDPDAITTIADINPDPHPIQQSLHRNITTSKPAQSQPHTSPDHEPDSDSDSYIPFPENPIPQHWYPDKKDIYPTPKTPKHPQSNPKVAAITICIHPGVCPEQTQHCAQPTALTTQPTEDDENSNSEPDTPKQTKSQVTNINLTNPEGAPCLSKITWHYQLPYINFQTHGIKGPCLLDLGAAISISSIETAQKISQHPDWSGTWNQTLNIEAYSCNQTQLAFNGLITIPNIKFGRQHTPMTISFWVLQASFSPLIISAHALRKLHGRICLTTSTLQYTPPPVHQILQAGGEKTIKSNQTHPPLDNQSLDLPTLLDEDDNCSSTEDSQTDEEPENTGKPPHRVLSIPPYTTATVTVPKTKYPNLTNPRPIQTACLDHQLPLGIRDKGKVLLLTIHNITPLPYHMASTTLHHNRISTMPNEITQRIQDRRDVRESTHLQGLIGLTQTNDEIIFPEIKQLGDPPFDQTTSKFTVFLAYILIVVGTSARITDKTAPQIKQLIQDEPTPMAQKLLDIIDHAQEQQNMNQLYTYIPRILCAHLHLQMYTCFSHLKKSAETQKSTMKRQQNKLILLNKLMTETQKLSLLYYYSQTILQDLCQAWGRHPFFIVTSQQLPVHQFYEKDTTPRSVNHIRSEAQLKELLYPVESQVYIPTKSNQEFKNKTLSNYEKLQDQADAQLLADRILTSKRAHQITDIKNERELNQLLDYSCTPTALHDFIADQTGQNPTPRIIPLSEFHQHLKPAKFICYKNIQEILDDFIPEAMRTEFTAFTKMMADRKFLEISSHYRLPDVPPQAIFDDTENNLSPLYYTDGFFAGLVDTKYLAFVCSQMIPHHHIILNSEFNLEHTHLCALLFVFGQHIAALHQSHVGLLDPRIFLLRTLLDPSAPTSLNNTKPLPTEKNADLDDKLAWALRTNRVKIITGAPYLARWTVIEKRRKDPKLISFPPNDPLLDHLLSLSAECQQDIADASVHIDNARQQAVTYLQDTSRPTVNSINHALAKLSLAHLHTLPPRKQKQTNKCTTTPLNQWIQWSTITSIIIKKIDEKTKTPWKQHAPISERDRCHIADKFINIRHKRTTKILKVRWNFECTIAYTETKDHDTQPVSPYFNQYFRTQEDYKNHNLMDTVQQIATNSRQLLKEPYTTWHRKHLKTPKPQVRYIFPAMANMPSITKNNISPTVANKQTKLTNFHAFHRLIQDCSTLTIENKISEDDPNYDDISQLASQTIVNSTLTLDSKTLLKNLEESPALQSLLVMTWNNLPPPTTKPRIVITAAPTCHLPPPPAPTSTTTDDLHCFNQYGAIHLISDNTTLFKKIPELISNYTRGLKHKMPLQQQATTRAISTALLSDLWPQQIPNIESLTIKTIHKHLKTWENLYKQVSDHFRHPILTLAGNIHCLNGYNTFKPTNLQLYGAEYYQDPPGIFSIIAICPDTYEAFPFRTKSPEITKLFQNLVAYATKHGPTNWTLQSLIIALQYTAEKQDQTNNARYSYTKIEHLQKTVAMKHTANRFIINAKFSNKLARSATTQFQPLSSIRETLANSQHFTSIDFASMYDSIPTDPISSLLSCVSYQGLEIAPLVASMGGTNSCLHATAVVLSIFRHVQDTLPLAPCYKPKPLPPELMKARLHKPDIPLTIQETYDVTPPLHLQACALLRKIADRECYLQRAEDSHHYLPLTAQERQQINRQPGPHLLDFTALIDDACVATRDIPQIKNLDTTEQIRVHLNIHIHALKTVFIALFQASPPVGNKSQPPSPMKIKFEKSSFFSSSARFLNYIYLRNHVVINLDSYKKHYSSLDNPPQTGEELKSFLSWITYFSNYIPCLRFLASALNKFATTHPGSKALPWKKNQDLIRKYKALTLATRQISGLHVLPDDLSQIKYLVISSDASKETHAHNLGVALKPVQDPSKTPTQDTPTTTLHLVTNYSAQLPTHIRNCPIVTKECAAALSAVEHLEEILKLTATIPKYLLLDNANLFQYLTSLHQTNQLGPHFLAHPNLKKWIIRLYEVTQIYNMEIRLITSKLCMADYLSRLNPDKQNEPKKKTECPQPPNKKATCDLCPGCNQMCQKAHAHKDCQFSIEGLPEDSPPNLLKYSDLEEHTVPNEDIKYTTASIQFNPDKYIQIDLYPLVAEIIDSPPDTEYLSAPDDTDLPDWTTVSPKYFEQQETKDIQDLKDHIANLTITASTQHTPPNVIHQWAPRNLPHQHQVTTHRNKYWTVPPNHFMIGNTGRQYPHGPHHCIILFTTEHKGLRTGQSRYIQALQDTAAIRLNQRTNAISVITHNNTVYLLLCAHKQLPTVPHDTSQLFTQLQKVLHKATSEFPEYTIVVDYNSCSRFYNLSPSSLLLLTAMNTSISPTGQSIIIVTNMPHTRKPKLDIQQQTQGLSRHLPVIVNNQRKAIIQITLNHLGECPQAATIALQALEQTDHNTPNYTKDHAFLNYIRGQFKLTEAPNFATAISLEFKKAHVMAIQINNKENTPVYDNLLTAYKVKIMQADDPTLLQMTQQARKHQGILVDKNNKIEIQLRHGVLLARDIGQSDTACWKPVLPEALILPEIASTHFKLKCANTKDTIKDIKNRYYHQTGLTSPHSLTQIAQNTMIPCPRCVIRKPAHLSHAQVYGQTKNILISLALNKRCVLVAHDILYLAKNPTDLLPNPYVSLFVCYGCGFVHTKALSIINGENIAEHFLDYCQTSGGPPHVLITDTHTAEIKGALRHTITDLNIISNSANQEIKKQVAQENYNGPRGEADENQNAEDDPPNFPTQTLQHLTPSQRAMLLQDFSNTNPPLYTHITSHTPPPNLTYQAFRNTSLGRLDKKCMGAATFIRRYITRDQASPNQVKYLLQAYTYYNNFLSTDIQTKFVPAALHLGTLKFTNLSTFYDNMARTESNQKQVKLLQQLIALAHTANTADNNHAKHQQKEEATHNRTHGTILTDEAFKRDYAPFTLVFLKSEHPAKKIDHNPPFHGPYLIVAQLTTSRILYLFELLTGKVYKRSYRSIIKYLPSPQTFTMPIDILGTWLDDHPLHLIRMACQSESATPEDQLNNCQTILNNLEQLYEFLSPVLPDAAATRNYINSFQDIFPADPPTVPTTEPQPDTNSPPRLTVSFQDTEDTIQDLPARTNPEVSPPVPEAEHPQLGPTLHQPQPPAPRQQSSDAPRRSPRTPQPNKYYQ